MKYRHRKAVRNASKGAKLLRYDPTRTTTLRNAFVASLKKRFSRLKLAMVNLIVRDDVFGLREKSSNPTDAFNAFCPTGEGGGHDNSCSPNSGAPKTVRIQNKAGAAGVAKKAVVVDTLDSLYDRFPALHQVMKQKINVELVEKVTRGESENPFGTHETVSTATGTSSRVSVRTKIGERPDSGPLTFGQPKVDASLSGTIRHEMGHALQSNYFKAEADSWKSAIEGVTPSVVSKYAGVNPQELHSESFSAYTHPSYERGSLPKSIESHFDKLLSHKPETAVTNAEQEPYYIQIQVGRDGSWEVVHQQDNLNANRLTTNDRWRFESDPQKIKLFQAWLKQQIGQEFKTASEQQLWAAYIRQGFEKGAGRSFDDVKAKRWSPGEGDFYSGSKQQFLKDSFAQPIAQEKLELLAGRAYDDLDGVTTAMSTSMSRKLTEGLVQGKSPVDIARDMEKDIDGIGKARALTIARTEIIAAHAEGQLLALEKLGVEEVGVAVEWSTTGDEKVCELCEPMEGVVLKLDEAKGMIPRHPNCRCAWIPANVGESDEQKDSKRAIEGAIRESLKRGGKEDSDGEEWGPGQDISKQRPESILNMIRLSDFMANAFCPTGPGGGVDPTCSPGGGQTTRWGNTPRERSALTKEELTQQHKRIKERAELNKKEKAGTITPQEKERLTQVKKEFADLDKVIKERLSQKPPEEKKEEQIKPVEPTTPPPTFDDEIVDIKPDEPKPPMAKIPDDTKLANHAMRVDCANEIKQRYGYKDEIRLLDKLGYTFKVAGNLYRCGGECHLASGQVTMYNNEIGKGPGFQPKAGDYRGLLAHEMMHGMYERVTSDRVGYPETEAAIAPLLKDKDQLIKDDGVSGYSKAYWEAYEKGEKTFHIAVHETLAEMARHREQGIEDGAKGSFVSLYHEVKRQYAKNTAIFKNNPVVINADELSDSYVFIDKDFNPVPAEEAWLVIFWRKDGTTGFAIPEKE